MTIPKQRSMQDWLSYIETLHSLEIDMGLDRVREVFNNLEVSDRLPYTVVVGGTNGKGSTLSAIEEGVAAVGLKCATYTSPHLYRFNERICVNGQEASDDAIIAAFECVERARCNTPLSYFEFTTLAAFCVFADKSDQLDLIICEVGLGGRLDAVNVLTADIAIVVSIGLDHQDWLGDTEELIAREKAGIFRPNAVNLVGETFPAALINAFRLSHDIKVCGQDFGFASDGCLPLSHFELGSFSYEIDCSGRNPIPSNNLNLAMQACLHVLDARSMLDEVSVSQCAKAISEVAVPGRLERWADNVVADVAHNGAAAEYLANHIERNYAGKRILAVFSCLKDKDINAIVEPLKRHVDKWFVAELDTPRGIGESALLEAIGVADKVEAFPTMYDAYTQAVNHLSGDDSVFVFGSFYVLESIEEHKNKLKEG